MINTSSFRDFLYKSLTSVNNNKINGLKAEAELKKYLKSISHESSISSGGWLFRSTIGENISFAENCIALIPDMIELNYNYENSIGQKSPNPSIYNCCQRLYSLGIDAYYAFPVNINIVDKKWNKGSRKKDLVMKGLPIVEWGFKQLGSPRFRNEEKNIVQIGENKFRKRDKPHNLLTKFADTSSIEDIDIPNIFTTQSLRIAFQEQFYNEATDFDGIIFGKKDTYPVEIKEKTVGKETSTPHTGDYFGLDISPFVKLSFFSNLSSNMNSLFIVREIDNEEDRNLKKWWVIKFKDITRFTCFTPLAGGKSAFGTNSVVVKIPKCNFSELNKEFMDNL